MTKCELPLQNGCLISFILSEEQNFEFQTYHKRFKEFYL